MRGREQRGGEDGEDHGATSCGGPAPGAATILQLDTNAAVIGRNYELVAGIHQGVRALGCLWSSSVWKYRAPFVVARCVELWRNNALPPLSTNSRTAVPCSGFIQCWDFGSPRSNGGSEINSGCPLLSQDEFVISSG